MIPQITEAEVKMCLKAFNRPDPPMSDDLKENIDNIRAWNWYDNYQSGKYVNENATGYGPTKVWNARVVIDSRFEWHGDVSERRLAFLKMLSEKFDLPITVSFERGEYAYEFIGIDGILPTLYNAP